MRSPGRLPISFCCWRTIGDNAWHLYNLRSDPGETQDLQVVEPDRFNELQEDYANYARTFGVLPISEGYEPIAQVQKNALRNAVLPVLAKPVIGLLIVLGLFWGWRRHRTLKGC